MKGLYKGAYMNPLCIHYSPHSKHMETKAINKEIRNWVRDIIPSLNGAYTLQELYPTLRALYNNNRAWDTWMQTECCGNFMTKMAILKAVKEGRGVTRIDRGTYLFA